MDNSEEIKKEHSDMAKDMEAGGPSVSPGQVLPSPSTSTSPSSTLTQTQAPPPPYPAYAPPPQGYQQTPPYGQMAQPGHMVQATPQQGPMMQATPQPIQMVQLQQGLMTQATSQPIQMVQMPQGQILVCSGDLGDIPTMTTCRNCAQKVQTRVVYHSGAFTWLICGLCIMFGLVFGCCVIPFFVDSCKDAHHFCTNCNVNLSIHKRL
ncbi:cell death-inducing p53-target protein 1 homolog [Sardina pilchardus]|uniref:cell death-inducing p53-target protein 1 homolog n=1 Tax=Sardina pilchardus TaxID=27697 RepID=UPI002E0D9434